MHGVHLVSEIHHFLIETSRNCDAVSTPISDPSDAVGADSTDSPRIANPRGKRAAGNRMPIWQIVLIGLVISAIAFLIVSTQGHVRGQEFSPTLFQAREFHFYEIPLLHVQMTPIRRSSATPRAATYVRQNSLIKPATSGSESPWHLVHLSRGVGAEKPADAELLMNQLNLTKAGKPYWRIWSVDNPEHAKKFWPIIQRLATRELYVLMPRLFELAQQAHTPDELKAKIDQQLQSDYVRLIQDLRDADRNDLAEQLRNEATADYPDDNELRSLPAFDENLNGSKRS